MAQPAAESCFRPRRPSTGSSVVCRAEEVEGSRLRGALFRAVESEGDRAPSKPVDVDSDSGSEASTDADFCSDSEPEILLRQREDSASEDSTETGGCSDAEAEGAARQGEPLSTFFVFDWDDTLLASTWLVKKGFQHNADFRLKGAQRLKLDFTARCVARTLKLAKELGRVVIVTNAKGAWVQDTARLLPALAPLLEGVRLVSAREAFADRAPDEPRKWKRLAFESEIGAFCQQLPPGSRANVVSLGDNLAERDALFEAVGGAPACWGKAIKLQEQPTLEEFVRQHELIQQCLAEVVGHQGVVDMSVEGAAGVICPWRA